MTRIDFHTNIAAPQYYVCRLIRKVSRQSGRSRILLLAENSAQCKTLDALLWAFDASSFLPHALLGHPLADQSPILLGCEEHQAPIDIDMLINLSGRLPLAIDRYQRIFEIVGADTQAVESARERYTQYKKRGYPPNHLQVQS